MLWDVLQIIQEYPASLVTFEDVNEDYSEKLAMNFKINKERMVLHIVVNIEEEYFSQLVVIKQKKIFFS